MSFIVNDPMPRNCTECDYRCGLNIIARKNQQGRHEHCPLVELPQHGRLIDADQLKHKTQSWTIGRRDDFYSLVINANATIKAILDSAPTILEASKEEGK